MRKSITRAAISAASRVTFSRGLKSLGFRRQANHLWRESDGLFHGVHFQPSQWGIAVAGSFTVNLIVTSSWRYMCWTGKPLPSNPATAMFPILERIGMVMPDRKDHWWDVAEETDPDVLAEEVAAMVLNYGVHFFDEYPSSGTILEKLRRGEALPGLTAAQLPLVHAMLAKERGLTVEADERISHALHAAGASPFKETIRLIKRRLEQSQVSQRDL